MLTQFLSTALMSLSLATGVKTSNISYDTNYELVYNKINSIYDNPSITNIEDIYNLVGENRYLKVDIYNDYYIIDKEDYKIIDNGLLSNDPYKNYTGLKLYLDSELEYKYIGLNDNKLIDLENHYFFDFKDFSFSPNDTSKNIKAGNYDDLRGEDQLMYTDDDIPYSKNTVFCDNYFYFEKLDFMHHANNSNNTCALVALEILLSYYDTFLNDNIVDENYEYNVKGYAHTVEDFDISPGVDNDLNDRKFHDYLYSLDPNHKFNDGFSTQEQKRVIRNYFKDKDLNVKYNYCTGDTLSDILTNYTITLIKRAINKGRPILVSGHEHSTVAYAYDEDYVYVHAGWGHVARTPWSTFKDYINYWTGSFDLEFNVPHIHSDNYYSFYDKSSVCSCGELHNHEIYHLSIDDDYHAHICECGLFQKEKHSLIADGYIKEVYVSLLNKYIKVPVITEFHCDICNYRREGE